jgi:23S rRNA (adenine-N6)-dimethyltransferase
MFQRHSSDLRRSQNFLNETRLIEHLVDLAGIERSDVVYDLGAGSGNLTAALARRARQVIAIEKDPALAAQLRTRFSRQGNVLVHERDLRGYPLPRSDYVVLANPPFDITASVVRALTSAPVAPRGAYLVLQREAGERFMGRPQMTLTALLIAPWFSLTVLHVFRRVDFTPAPAVDAVFVRLHKRGPPLISEDAQLYRDFVVSCFSAWRPTLAESMAHVLGRRAGVRILKAASANGDGSPSQVRVATWLRLYRTFETAPSAVRERVLAQRRGCVVSSGIFRRGTARGRLVTLCALRPPPYPLRRPDSAAMRAFKNGEKCPAYRRCRVGSRQSLPRMIVRHSGDPQLHGISHSTAVCSA